MGLNIGGNIKSIYFGGNVKEIWLGSNKIFGGGGGDPMPEGFEKVDYLECIQNSTRVYLYEDNSTKWFNDITQRETFDIIADIISDNTDYLYFTMYGMIGGGYTYQIGVQTHTNGHFAAANSSPTGGGQNTRLLSNWDGTLTRIEISRRSDGFDEFTINGTKYVSSRQGYFWSGGGGIGYLFRGYRYGGSRFVSIKIFDNSRTTLKHHLVSARRISDNAPAVVDLVTQEFIVANSSWFRAVKA